MTVTYLKPAALEAYLLRIGAEELNFRRYIKRDYKGTYYTEQCIIKIEADGSIKVSNKDYAPTKEEAEAIKGSLSGINWPRTIKARNTDGLVGKVKQDSMLFEFRTYEGEDDIIMVQERVNLGGGNKKFRPWTLFSDGEWRCMEPDGPLPFWRPQPTGLVRFMIHEGGKAARYVDELLRTGSAADHPWFSELAKYEHWGMIGGALAPHRTDYVSLKKQNPMEVIYVCDNDWAGKSALQKISKEYGGSMKGVKFDKDFPEGWDLADPMPPNLFTDGGRYIGRPFWRFVKKATFATESVPNPDGKSRSILRLRDSFKEEWAHCVKPEVYIHLDDPDNIMTASEFNNEVSPFSDADDTARLLRKDDTSKSVVLHYAPDRKPGIYVSENGGRFFNTHVPSPIKAEEGDPALWLEFMDHLIADPKDQHEMMRWIATLISRPDIKMLYGVLLISEAQGVGKGTLGEKILAPLVGSNNTSYPNESEIVDSNFNYWAAHKRLAVVHEIYAGHSAKGYNRLKSIITDKYITVSKKYQANYEIENWMHIFACSNSTRALLLSDDDRRWFVPKITERKKPAEWWVAFNRWLNEEGGLGIIKNYCNTWVKQHNPVVTGESAPWSTLKRELIEDNMSQGQLLVAQTLDRIKSEMNGSTVLIADSALVQLIRDQVYEGRHNDRLEKPATVRRVAKNRGWYISQTRAFVKDWGTLTTGPRLICSDPDEAQTSPGELAKAGKTLFRVGDFINQTKEL